MTAKSLGAFQEENTTFNFSAIVWIFINKIYLNNTNFMFSISLSISNFTTFFHYDVY